jgi:hypothetical protein
MTTSTQDQIALIGAGPSGLAGARCLQKHGIPFQGFEAHTDVGGLWNIHNPRSTVYESAHLISSKRMTEFSEFPMADRVADYPSHRELLAYFSAFADHFRLREHYRFGVRVRSVVPVSDAPDTLWRVTLEDADGLQTAADYKGVVVANGTLAEPNMPRFEGHFAGELLHTSAYKSSDQFRHKRVLIVGAGNSGCDIAVDAVHQARSVDISVRRGYYFVPKYVFGKPADTIGGKVRLPPWLKQRIDSTILKWFTGDPVRFGFPKPAYRMYESHPVVNSLILYHIGHGDVGVPTSRALTATPCISRTVARATTTWCSRPPATSCTTPSWTRRCSTGKAWRRGFTSTSWRRALTAWPCSAWSRPAAWDGRDATSKPSWWRAISRDWTKARPAPPRCAPRRRDHRPIFLAATSTCSSSAWPTT